MKAMIVTAYGSPDVFRLTEVPKPEPKDTEIRVKVYATSINYGDLAARNFGNISAREFNMPFLFWLPAKLAFGLRKPKVQILGAEFAGEVEAVGSAVTRFKVGDAVFGYRGMNMGANAEYLCMPENSVVAHKPTNMRYEEAASLPYGALTALSLLKKANIQPGQRVLILGASGAIGSAALQLAKHFGARVTGVCSTPRMGYVRALGADDVIDYRREDFTTSGEQYDLIFDVLGRGSFARSKRALKPKGRYLFASFKLKQVAQALWTSLWRGKRAMIALSSESPDDLAQVKALAEAGALKTIIDRCYRLEEIAEAHRYVESGDKSGSVVITVAQPQPVLQPAL